MQKQASAIQQPETTQPQPSPQSKTSRIKSSLSSLASSTKSHLITAYNSATSISSQLYQKYKGRPSQLLYDTREIVKDIQQRSMNTQKKLYKMQEHVQRKGLQYILNFNSNNNKQVSKYNDNNTKNINTKANKQIQNMLDKQLLFGLAAYGTTKLATLLIMKSKLSLAMLYKSKLAVLAMKVVPVAKAGVITYAPYIVPTIAAGYFGYLGYVKYIQPKYFPSKQQQIKQVSSQLEPAPTTSISQILAQTPTPKNTINHINHSNNNNHNNNQYNSQYKIQKLHKVEDSIQLNNKLKKWPTNQDHKQNTKYQQQQLTL